MPKYVVSVHKCELLEGSESCLPRLPPYAGAYKRFNRKFRKLFIASESNIWSRRFFRSHARILAERKRHARSSYWYMIHPLSYFSIYKEFLMCAVWMWFFIKRPLDWAITHEHYITNVEHLFIFFNIIILFFTGYKDMRNREVIMYPKMVAKHYLKRYFFLDVFAILPIATCYYKGTNYHHSFKDFVFLSIAMLQDVVQFVRLGTVMKYIKLVTDYFEWRDASYQIFRLVLMTCYFLHWWTCMLYTMPVYAKYMEIADTSWTLQASIEQNSQAYLKYISSFLLAMCCFYRAGTEMYQMTTVSGQIMCIFIIVSGGIYVSYMIVVVSQIVNVTMSTSYKYEDIISQMRNFMRNKHLPRHLQKRLLDYTQYRFQNKYFNETLILSTLSEHLRHEILLFSCRTLVENVEIFRNLPKAVIGAMIACLKRQIYLPNDVIAKVGATAECIYFISCGTVAVYTPSGKEICHLADGQHFGEIAVVLQNLRIANVVAIETTKVYLLELRDFERCLKHFPNIRETLEDVAEKQLNIIMDTDFSTGDKFWDAKRNSNIAQVI